MITLKQSIAEKIEHLCKKVKLDLPGVERYNQLFGTNLNPTIGSINFGYTLSAVSPNFDFNQDINTSVSDSSTGVFTLNPSTENIQDEISFTSTDDATTEGFQIFKVQTQVGINLLEKQCTIFDDSLAWHSI